jgi:hypothetical protein
MRIHGHYRFQSLQQRARSSGEVVVCLPAAGERMRKVDLQQTAGIYSTATRLSYQRSGFMMHGVN